MGKNEKRAQIREIGKCKTNENDQQKRSVKTIKPNTAYGCNSLYALHDVMEFVYFRRYYIL